MHLRRSDDDFNVRTHQWLASWDRLTQTQGHHPVHVLVSLFGNSLVQLLRWACWFSSWVNGLIRCLILLLVLLRFAAGLMWIKIQFLLPPVQWPGRTVGIRMFIHLSSTIYTKRVARINCTIKSQTKALIHSFSIFFFLFLLPTHDSSRMKKQICAYFISWSHRIYFWMRNYAAEMQTHLPTNNNHF